VVGSLRYAHAREELRPMAIGLFSRCLGCNSTLFAFARYPQEFANVRCLVGAQPLSPRFYYERQLDLSGVPSDRIEELDHLIRRTISFGFEQLSPVEAAKSFTIPAFIYQVRHDVMTDPADVQTIFDSMASKAKELFWIEETTRRWDGYNYFSREPHRMLDWFARYLS
jgi:hypothetical protein